MRRDELFRAGLACGCWFDETLLEWPEESVNVKKLSFGDGIPFTGQSYA